MRGGAGFPHEFQGSLDSELPFYKVKALGAIDASGGIGPHTDSVSRSVARRLGAAIIPAGSLGFAKVGAALLMSRVGMIRQDACIDNNMAAFVPGSQIDSRFARASLSQFPFAEFANPGAVPSLNMEALLAFKIRLPTLDEQRAIADYLDEQTAKIDTLIAKQNEMIRLLEERNAAVVAATVLELDGPRDRLSRRCVIGNGSTPRRDNPDYWTNGSLLWLNSSVVNLREVTGGDSAVSESALRECHLPRVGPGTVLVALTGQGKTRGAATILRVDATINQHLAYVSPDRKCWVPEFLLWILTNAYGELRRTSDENGSTKGGLTCADLGAFKVPMPSLEAQERVAVYLDAETAKIGALIAKTREHIALAKERRSALITAAVTGQFDVPTTSARGVA